MASSGALVAFWYGRGGSWMLEGSGVTLLYYQDDLNGCSIVVWATIASSTHTDTPDTAGAFHIHIGVDHRHLRNRISGICHETESPASKSQALFRLSPRSSRGVHQTICTAWSRFVAGLSAEAWP